MCLCLGLAVVLASAAAITTAYFITRGSPLGMNGKLFNCSSNTPGYPLLTPSSVSV